MRAVERASEARVTTTGQQRGGHEVHYRGFVESNAGAVLAPALFIDRLDVSYRLSQLPTSYACQLQATSRCEISLCYDISRTCRQTTSSVETLGDPGTFMLSGLPPDP